MFKAALESVTQSASIVVEKAATYAGISKKEGALDAAIKEDSNPNTLRNANTGESDVNISPNNQNAFPETTAEFSPTTSNIHVAYKEKIEKPKKNPANDFMLAFQSKLESNDFVSAFGLILDSKETNKPDLLRLFTTKLDKHDISIEKFIIDDYPEKFNNEMLDILLIRAKELPEHHYANQENDYFNRYWKFILDYLIQQRDWSRLHNFLDALPPHAGYYKFILTKITGVECQKTLLKKTGWDVNNEELVSHAINLDLLDLIKLLMNGKMITSPSLTIPEIAKKAFENTTKAWRILAYCAENLTEDEKKQTEIIQFWTQLVLEAAINTQRWSFAKTIISLFPFQEHYKNLYPNANAECQRELQQCAGWMSFEELQQHGDIKNYISNAKNLDINFQENFIKQKFTALDVNFQKKLIAQTFSNDELYLLAKALIDNNFLINEHIPLVADWVKRKFNDRSIKESDKTNPEFVSLVLAIAQNETFMSDDDINSTICDKALNLALGKDYKELIDTLLERIFSNYLKDSSRTSAENQKKLLTQIKTALEKIILYQTKKNVSQYISSVSAFHKYIEELLNTTSTTLKHGSAFFPLAETDNNAMAICTLFTMLKSSTNNNLDLQGKISMLKTFDKQLAQEHAALRDTAKKTPKKINWGNKK